MKYHIRIDFVTGQYPSGCERTEEVYAQVVEDLNLNAVICAINQLPMPAGTPRLTDARRPTTAAETLSGDGSVTALRESLEERE